MKEFFAIYSICLSVIFVVPFAVFFVKKRKDIRDKIYYIRGTIRVSILRAIVKKRKARINRHKSKTTNIFVQYINEVQDKARRSLEKIAGVKIVDKLIHKKEKLSIIDKLIHKKEKLSIIDKLIHKKEKPSIIDKLLHSNKKPKSIVDIVYNKKKKQMDHALILAFVGLLLYCFINIFFHADTKVEMLILAVLCGLIILLRLLVSYRVRKGYYGMNYEECKELIHYLMDDKDKNDINKGKKIFNEIEDYYKVGQEVTGVVGDLQ